MELRNLSPPTPKVAALLIMTSLLLLTFAVSSSPATATEEPMKTAAVAEAEYDVDYRGPETHPADFPPAPTGHFRGRTPFHRR